MHQQQQFNAYHPAPMYNQPQSRPYAPSLQRAYSEQSSNAAVNRSMVGGQCQSRDDYASSPDDDELTAEQLEEDRLLFFLSCDLF